jgi:TolA-binding protein
LSKFAEDEGNQMETEILDQLDSLSKRVDRLRSLQEFDPEPEGRTIGAGTPVKAEDMIPIGQGDYLQRELELLQNQHSQFVKTTNMRLADLEPRVEALFDKVERIQDRLLALEGHPRRSVATEDARPIPADQIRRAERLFSTTSHGEATLHLSNEAITGLDKDTNYTSVREMSYNQGYSLGYNKAIEDAKQRIRNHTANHFSTATIEGLLNAIDLKVVHLSNG